MIDMLIAIAMSVVYVPAMVGTIGFVVLNNKQRMKDSYELLELCKRNNQS